METIYTQAFSNCPELTDVYCNTIKVPSMINDDPPYDLRTDAFEGSYIEYATLHVPENSIDTYKSTDPWKDFKEIVKVMPMFSLIYFVDGEVYRVYQIEEDTNIIPEAAPTKEGYTFSGWSDIPETMPAHDVTVSGSFAVNQYTITYVINNEVFATEKVDYGSVITPPSAPVQDGYDFAWSNYPETMPAYNITIYGSYTTGVGAITLQEDAVMYLSVDGKRHTGLQKGLNIVRMRDGTTKKVVVK